MAAFIATGRSSGIANITRVLNGSLQSLDWNSGLEWWNGMVESLIQKNEVKGHNFWIPDDACNKSNE